MRSALLLAAAHAPFTLRFVLQPVLALVLGLRDGRWDAREGRAPFGGELLVRRGARGRLLREGLRRVAWPLALSTVLDGVVQWMVGGHVVLLDAVAVGLLLVALPYVFSRGLSNRWLSRSRRWGRAVR